MLIQECVEHKFMSYQVQEAEQWVCSLECEVPSAEPGLRSLWVEIWGHCPSNSTEKRETLSILKKVIFDEYWIQHKIKIINLIYLVINSAYYSVTPIF